MTNPTPTKVSLVHLDGEPFEDWVKDKLHAEGIALRVHHCQSRQELAEHAHDAEIVWLFGGSTILRGNLDVVPRCWAVLRTGSGTDNVPIDEATERGIVVANTPAAFCDGVSDHVIGLMFSAARRIVSLDRSMRDGQWNIAAARPLRTIRGQTLGLVGFGHIGRDLAQKLRGLEMRVLAYDPFAAHEALRSGGAEPAALERLLAESDFVSLHCPLTPQTRHLISERQLRLMKPTAIFINTSRGPVVDEPALLRALQEGWITAAALDVFEEEPLPPGHPLLKLDNVVLTPHTAGMSERGIALRWRHSIESLTALARRRWPPSCVNRQVRPKEPLRD